MNNSVDNIDTGNYTYFDFNSDSPGAPLLGNVYEFLKFVLDAKIPTEKEPLPPLEDRKIKKIDPATKPEKYKTELCRNHLFGNCQHGDGCNFAHGIKELRQVERDKKYKTDLCRTFEETGKCPYKSRCRYAHGEKELRPK
jgi:butyrate response factor 1